MNRIYRLLHAERGIALMSVMVAVFILTIVVAAMAIATMGETTLSFDQLRGQQAVGVAEAGAYRALAELRRRIALDLDLKIRTSGVTEATLQNICTGAASRERVEIITQYAYPGASTDWVRTGGTATLNIGTPGSRILIADSVSGATIGDFYAQIIVRWSGAASTCSSGPNVPDQFVMYFDYALFAVGRSGNAERGVCLRSPFADRCPDWLPSAGAGAWAGSNGGWPVLVEQAAYSQWALMLLNVGSVWLYTGTQVNGPVHSNTRIQIAGDPILKDVVTQVNPDMRFFNCGSPTLIAIPASDPNATLRTSCGPGADNTNWSDPLLRTFQGTVTGGVAPVPLPSNSHPSRPAVGLSAGSTPATDAEVAQRTTDLDDTLVTIPPGLYVMDQCTPLPCGGVYVKGDVTQMLLTSETGAVCPGGGSCQVLYVTVPSSGDPNKADLRIAVNPTTKDVIVSWGSGWGNSQTYLNTFNGMFFVNGAIQSTFSMTNPGGLWGVVHRNMRLTIATEGELRITDHLVYENPPAGPGHNPINVLGLYSVTGDITIHGAVTPDNLYIDAAVLSPGARFWVEEWDILPLKGNIYFLGGTVQGTFGAWGGFSPDTGYGRVMTYDWRLRSNVSPPYFPQTDIYTAVRSNQGILGALDQLYNRPLWEELVGL